VLAFVDITDTESAVYMCKYERFIPCLCWAALCKHHWQTLLKLTLAVLCTACTLVWFDFVCIVCALSWPFWISLPERLYRPNFTVFFLCGLVLSALSVHVFSLVFTRDKMAFLTDCHILWKLSLFAFGHSPVSSPPSLLPTSFPTSYSLPLSLCH